jgi:ferredoxin
MSSLSREIAYLRVEHDGKGSLLVAPVGVTLRDALLANGVSPYSSIAERLNCGGRGLCGTCGVRFPGDDATASDDAESSGPSEFGAGETGADRDNGNGAERSGERETDGDGAPAPEHWHDSLAARFGYPRLSCQIEVEGDMHLRIPEKIVWGSRRSGDGDESNKIETDR